VTWDFVTDFGDSAVTVPLALLTLIFLVVAGRGQLALGWGLAIGGCGVAIGALKLVFGACNSGLTTVGIVSPSGHTAMSVAVYGSLALLVAARLPRRFRSVVISAAAVSLIVIAVSRIVLHDHTPAEIAVGLIVGAGAVGGFRAVLRHHEAPPLGGLLLLGAGLVAALHGTRWMIEPELHRLAWDFRLAVPWCR
jgi:membrane-associated phospholipid phosphatase